MKKSFALLVVSGFTVLASGAPAQADHEVYTFRYFTGGDISGNAGAICLIDIDGATYSIGGSCFNPCPHGTCDITVIDDIRGTDAWFRIQVDDEPFFRPVIYSHQVSVEGERVRVAVLASDGTTGIITIA